MKSTMSAAGAVVCDDDPVIRNVVGTVLESYGFEVTAAVGLATDAVRVAELTSPRVVVIDVALMGMSGIEAIPAIKRAAPDCDVVVYSAFDNVREEAMAAGATAVVDKADPQLLEVTLQSLFGEEWA
jgi:CheY-like chemotaxis protein